MTLSVPSRLSLAVMLGIINMLAGCAQAPVLGLGLATSYLTKPDTPAAADTANQIPEHESWCYRTMGFVECYSQPQDVPATRLVNVDPANRYPLTARSYNEAVMQAK
jgi:hypothetical protein